MRWIPKRDRNERSKTIPATGGSGFSGDGDRAHRRAVRQGSEVFALEKSVLSPRARDERERRAREGVATET